MGTQAEFMGRADSLDTPEHSIMHRNIRAARAPRA
jgi:hypothetical protein